MEEYKEPTLINKAKSLGNAAVNWATQDGFRKVPEEIFQSRKNTCLACPNWDAAAFGNTGRCKLCGCSVMKLYIPSAVCPDKPPRWESIQAS